MNPKRPTGVNIDNLHANRRFWPAWPDGTRKSMNNDFNWTAPRNGPNIWVAGYVNHPRKNSLNPSFNVTFSDNVNGI
jgi:hypothetical protein